MGREWHCSRSLARREKESPGCMSGMLHYFDFHHLLFTASSPTGAPLESPPEVHQSTSQLKGIEAPRNSLDLDTEKASSTLAIAEEYYDVPVGIQVVPKPAALTARSKMVTLLEEERRSSLAETPRTPGVVARLMGLEVLADQASTPATPCRRSPPSVKSLEQSRKKNKKAFKGECRKESAFLRQPLQNINCNVAGRYEVGSRSLPETPRVSSARSWYSDPRLSLQLNKENTNKAMQEFSYLCEVPGYHSLPPSPLPSMAKSRRKNFGRQLQDENKSPRGHYHGCEIVKQVKESITRRGGGSSDEIEVRSTRSPEPKISCNAGTWSQNKSPPTKPPSEPSKSKPVKDHIPKSHQLPNFPCPRAPSPNSFRARHNMEAKAVKIGPSKCKKASYERFTERIKKQQHPASEKAARPGAGLLSPSQPAASVLQKHLSEKKCRSPSFVTLKRKEASLPKASLPKARPVPEQVHHCPSSSVQEQKVMILGVEGALMPSKTQRCPQRLVPEEQDPEYGYVRSILELGGITGLAIPSFRWYSSSLPVDPIIFHQLELRFPFFPPEAEPQYCKEELEEAILPSSLRHRWNRKLLFHLVEEILGDLLGYAYLTTTHTNRPVAKLHGIMSHRDQADGELLLKELWRQIQSFPSADCQVVGDIDALVAGDLPEAKIRRLLLHPLVVEEAEDVALEVEQEIFDGLLGETAASVALTSLYSQRNIAS